jgi:hypothetical protein
MGRRLMPISGVCDRTSFAHDREKILDHPTIVVP